uniref:DUF4375 domain-containing protein n=1 Tax=Panagrellus redivivus TaxID=6233 RepID=A0A7E5A144_PANRE
MNTAEHHHDEAPMALRDDATPLSTHIALSQLNGELGRFSKALVEGPAEGWSDLPAFEAALAALPTIDPMSLLTVFTGLQETSRFHNGIDDFLRTAMMELSLTDEAFAKILEDGRRRDVEQLPGLEVLQRAVYDAELMEASNARTTDAAFVQALSRRSFIGRMPGDSLRFGERRGANLVETGPETDPVDADYLRLLKFLVQRTTPPEPPKEGEPTLTNQFIVNEDLVVEMDCIEHVPSDDELEYDSPDEVNHSTNTDDDDDD